MRVFAARLCGPLVLMAMLAPLQAADAPVGKQLPVYSARDSLGDLTDMNPDAADCLRNFHWKRGEFQVTCEDPGADDSYDALVRFPSPIESGDARNDRVAMEWYRPKDRDGKVISAPAIVVIHESGSAMPAGRSIAMGLRDRGLHSLLIHLPHYGARRTPGKRPDAAKLVETMRQGVADVRRARDAVAALPGLNASHIALQGTSLGGFVAALSGSLDRGFHSVFIMLAGGDLEDLFENGRRDTRKVREKLAEAGYTGEKLKALIRLVEPTRIAHRLDPKRTWTYGALQDDVVPIRNTRKLAKVAGLADDHQIELLGGHFTAALYLPVVMDRIAKDVQTLATPAPAGTP